MTRTLRRKGSAGVGYRARLRVTLKVYVGPRTPPHGAARASPGGEALEGVDVCGVDDVVDNR